VDRRPGHSLPRGLSREHELIRVLRGGEAPRGTLSPREDPADSGDNLGSSARIGLDATIRVMTLSDVMSDLAAAVVAALIATSVPVPAAPDLGSNRVTYGRDLAVRSGVHLGIGQRRVVQSVALPGLGRREKLTIRAEVELTSCAQSDLHTWPCGDIHLRPEIVATLILADDAFDDAGAELVRATRRCDATIHHCPLTMTHSFEVDPAIGARSHVNLVVESRAPTAEPGDSLEVKDSSSGRGGGQLTVIRTPAEHAVPAIVTRSAVKRLAALPVQTGAGNPTPKKRVMFSVPVSRLRDGAILDVDGTVRMTLDPRVRQNGVPALLATEIVLSDSPRETDALAVPLWQRVALNSGVNCSLTCTIHRVGAIQVKDAVNPVMYVNFIGLSSRTTSRAEHACQGTCEATIRQGALVVHRIAPDTRTRRPLINRCRWFEGFVIRTSSGVNCSEARAIADSWQEQARIYAPCRAGPDPCYSGAGWACTSHASPGAEGAYHNSLVYDRRTGRPSPGSPRIEFYLGG
jgi:hypothetical protein